MSLTLKQHRALRHHAAPAAGPQRERRALSNQLLRAAVDAERTAVDAQKATRDRFVVSDRVRFWIRGFVLGLLYLAVLGWQIEHDEQVAERERVARIAQQKAEVRRHYEAIARDADGSPYPYAYWISRGYAR